jgi:cytochrome c oxidase cbb3-type subunit 1
MSQGLHDVPATQWLSQSERPPSQEPLTTESSHILLLTAWHSLLWLVVANAIGVLIAILLLVPRLNGVLNEWTYGRWVMVHMNLELYGWCSLPLVAFLFELYGAHRESAAVWCRSALWAWSAALGVGAVSWLNGSSSGKLFLDWSGYARILFPLALVVLWLVLAYALSLEHRNPSGSARALRFSLFAKLVGLLLLAAVPVLIYVASSPGLYPPINPDSGGPTGASQLESSLVIVGILLLLPYGLAERKNGYRWQLSTAWGIFAVETILCIALGRADVSHHRPLQFLSLGSLLIWIPLTPSYYGAFHWHRSTRLWRIAFLCWWSALLLTGWCLFLPGVLDRFKFTDGLVGHSLLAMAGFASSLLIFVMVQLLGEAGWIFNGNRSFYAWHVGVTAYVLLMTFAGWMEAHSPAFTMLSGTLRNITYLSRLLSGMLMLLASVAWLRDASQLLRSGAPAQRVTA